eukprot:TRINITY_DN15841_c0_g1_i1.p1 TRINITY_DN15841_c0_g1~~TRINITY_DN15841_c0_g1_i1.p1  ORF type:complete len:125 (-),score=35.03 TRINITY_DN15841_c0_g1_i1:20-394(-)
MAAQPSGITKLLEAEREANEIVDAARKARTKLMKEAEGKAKAERDKFQAEQEAEYQTFAQQSGGQSDEIFGKLQQDTTDQITKLQESARRNKEQVIAKLLQYVADVSTDVHPNIIVAQKLVVGK